MTKKQVGGSRMKMRKNQRNKDKKRKKHRLRKTTVLVRGYCSDFEVEIRKDHFYTIEEAIEFIQRTIINTAMIRGVKHHLSNGELYIKNDNFVDPTDVIKNKKIL